MSICNGEDLERWMKVWVFSTSVRSRWVHNDEWEMSISLHRRHTWVDQIRSRSVSSVSKWFGMREKTSGGIRLIGARKFFTDRTRWRTSDASCSTESNTWKPFV